MECWKILIHRLQSNCRWRVFHPKYSTFVTQAIFSRSAAPSAQLNRHWMEAQAKLWELMWIVSQLLHVTFTKYYQKSKIQGSSVACKQCDFVEYEILGTLPEKDGCLHPFGSNLFKKEYGTLTPGKIKGVSGISYDRTTDQKKKRLTHKSARAERGYNVQLHIYETQHNDSLSACY